MPEIQPQCPSPPSVSRTARSPAIWFVPTRLLGPSLAVPRLPIIVRIVLSGVACRNLTAVEPLTHAAEPRLFTRRGHVLIGRVRVLGTIAVSLRAVCRIVFSLKREVGAADVFT